MNRFAVCMVAVTLSVSTSYASWQNPVFLSELNDFEHGFSASRVHVSSDERCIFFTRSTPSKFDALWEGHRNPDTLVFDQQRQLAELKNGGEGVYGVWMSEDKLRLYYAVTDPQFASPRRPVWMAIRDNPDAPWQTIKRYNELEIEIFQTNCTLTEDEKIIMWETAPFAGAGLKRIFTAARPSILHNFSHFREAVELEAIQAWAPLMSKDGRIVFFRREIMGGDWEEWMGHRDSLDLPFGDFTPLEGLNDFGMVVDPCLSGDRKHIYYRFRPGDVFDINNTGIYVSEWVDDSFDDAIRNLHEATAKKQRVLELLTEATANERTAAQILTTLPPQAMPAELNVKNLRDVLRLVQQSVNKETEAIAAVTSSIKYL